MEPPRPSESFVTRFQQLTSGSAKRRVDLELRGLDIVLSSIFLLISVVIVVPIGVAMLVTDGPPLLYRGERVGRGGRIFTMFKFRTLRGGAEQRLGHDLGDELVRRTREELTPLGGWLRATQLDELPQLWNVLRGDMSLVGPRPIRPRFFEQLAGDLPSYWQRLVVRPGLTGFAQVRRGYETSMAEKLAHDLEWIADRSVRLYLRTLVLPPGASRASPYTSRRESSRSRSRSTRCITSSAIRPSLRSATTAERSASRSSRRARWYDCERSSIAPSSSSSKRARKRLRRNSYWPRRRCAVSERTTPFVLELLEPRERGVGRVDAGLRFLLHVEPVVFEPEQANDERQREPLHDERREHDAEREVDDQIAVGERARPSWS